MPNSSPRYYLVDPRGLPPNIQDYLKTATNGPVRPIPMEGNGELNAQMLQNMVVQQKFDNWRQGQLSVMEKRAKSDNWYYYGLANMPDIPEYGRHAQLTSWYYAAPFGQPRGINIIALRTLAASWAVNMCVQVRQNEVASLDWDIVPIEKKQPGIKNNIKDAKDFFDHPNNNQESFMHILKSFLRDLFEMDAGVWVKTFEGPMFNRSITVPDMTVTAANGELIKLQETWGKELTYSMPTKTAVLTEIYARDGASFLKDVDVHGQIRGYWQYSLSYPQSTPVPFSDREIVYAMSNPLSRTCYGWSPLQSIEHILHTLINSVLHNEKLFERNMVPRGILAVLDMSKTDFNIFEAYFNEKVRGDPQRIPVISPGGGGDVKWIPFTPTNEDLQFLESQEWYLKLVAGTFEINFNELGFTDSINRSTAEEQSQVFRRRAIRPLLKLLEYYINLELVQELWHQGITGVKFKFVPFIDSHEQARITGMHTQDIQSGKRTINEIREEELGKDPVDWGNAPEWWIQLQHQKEQGPRQPESPWPQGPPTKPTGPAPQSPQFDEDRIAEIMRRELQNSLAGIMENTGATKTAPAPIVQTSSVSNSSTPFTWTVVEEEPALRDAYYDLPNPSDIEEYDPRAMTPGPLETEFQKALRELFVEQEEAILKELGILQKQFRTGMELAKIVQAWGALQETHFLEILKASRHFIFRGIHRGGNKAWKELHLKGEFSLDDPDAERFMQDYSQLLAQSKFWQVRERMRKHIVEALETGESVHELGQRITKEFSDIKTWEAERIARTEILRAMNAGRVMGYKRSRVVKAQQWLVTWDDRLCEQCRPMANKTVGLDEPFITPTGLRVYVPQELHPNCRCTVVPVLHEDVGKSIQGALFTKSAKMKEVEGSVATFFEAVPPVEITEVMKGMYEGGMTTEAIGHALGTTKQTISNWLNQMEIPTRPVGFPVEKAEQQTDAEGHKGRWVTIRGRRVFIREGESMEDAFKRQSKERRQEKERERKKKYGQETRPKKAERREHEERSERVAGSPVEHLMQDAALRRYMKRAYPGSLSSATQGVIPPIKPTKMPDWLRRGTLHKGRQELERFDAYEIGEDILIAVDQKYPKAKLKFMAEDVQNGLMTVPTSHVKGLGELQIVLTASTAENWDAGFKDHPHGVQACYYHKLGVRDPDRIMLFSTEWPPADFHRDFETIKGYKEKLKRERKSWYAKTMKHELGHHVHAHLPDLIINEGSPFKRKLPRSLLKELPQDLKRKVKLYESRAEQVDYSEPYMDAIIVKEIWLFLHQGGLDWDKNQEAIYKRSPEENPTAYGRSNKSEDFAESYTMFWGAGAPQLTVGTPEHSEEYWRVLDGTHPYLSHVDIQYSRYRLKRDAPLRYQFMKWLFAVSERTPPNFGEKTGRTI